MNTQRRVPDIEIERIALGELSPSRREEVLEQLRAEPGGMERVDALMASNEDILVQYPSHLMAVQIREKAKVAHAEQSQTRRSWMLAFPAVSVAVAAVALVLVLNPGKAPNSSTSQQSNEVILTKGDNDATLYVFRKGKDSVEEILTNGAEVGVGDVLQLKYNARGALYGVIFSVDGRGSVSLHFPSKSVGSTALEKGAHALNYSYELDDAPQFERFFFVTANEKLDVEDILDAGRKLKTSETAKLRLPDFATAVEFLVKKSVGN
jgi:hypothetical protein